MDNCESVTDLGPQAIAGPSGLTRKRKKSSSASSSSSSSSSCSASSSTDKEKKHSRRSHRSRHKKSKRRRTKRMIDKLFEEMGELRKQFLTGNIDSVRHDNASCFSDVSGKLYEHNGLVEELDTRDTSSFDINFDLETKLKEPLIPKTPDSYLKMLIDVQRLGCISWSDVRYSDTQKSYNCSPGFIDLETNIEVKKYDTLRHLAHTEKAYAALTFCILKQKEALQDSIRELLCWVKSTPIINNENLNSKIEDLFLNGDLHKISSDLMQIICGHRAEIIEMRREAISTQIRDPLLKATINKIPPSPSHIFNEEVFTAALEKVGGVRRAFWPPKAGTKPQPNNRPSRGQGTRNKSVPSRGTQWSFHEPATCLQQYTCGKPPSRGGYQFGNCEGQGYSSSTRFDHNSYDRRSHPNRSSRSERNRGRANNQKVSRGAPKRYKQ